MDQHQHRRNTRMLWGMILLAIAYTSWLHYVHTLTGMPVLDGSLGVALGLCICSHPAANAVDALFFDRHNLRQISSEWSGIGWLALNILVLLAGWVVIFVGLIQLTA